MYGSKNWGCAVPVEDSRLYRRGGRLSWRVVEASGSLWYSCKPGEITSHRSKYYFYNIINYTQVRLCLLHVYPGATIFIIPGYGYIYYTQVQLYLLHRVSTVGYITWPGYSSIYCHFYSIRKALVRISAMLYNNKTILNR